MSWGGFISGVILNCDYRDVIDVAKFDIIVTDIPYNIGMPYDNYADRLSDEEYIELLRPLAGRRAVIVAYPEATQKFLVPALGPADYCMAWCYNANIPHRFRLLNFYGCKPDLSRVRQPYKNPNDKRVKKYIQAGSEGTSLYEWFADIQLVKNVSKEKTSHPCPIPEALAERVILLTTDPGDIVADFFAGCLTVAVAAKRTGRNYLMCELSPRYVAEGIERLKAV